MLTIRQSAILEALVRQYVGAAAPVSSREIAQRLPVRVSSATIRNEMAELEAEGFLAQPHVSAGRIPTIDAFRFLAEEMLRDILPRVVSGAPQIPAGDPDGIARALARDAEAVSFVAAGSTPRFAGFEFVFSAPELRLEGALRAFAQLLDISAAWPERLGEALCEPIGVFIGKENPLFESEYFSVVAARFPRRHFIALIGPVRMDYERAVASLSRFFV